MKGDGEEGQKRSEKGGASYREENEAEMEGMLEI